MTSPKPSFSAAHGKTHAHARALCTVLATLLQLTSLHSAH